MLIEMEIASLGIDPAQNMPVVILKDVATGEMVLPIWIGVLEATAIALKLESVEVARPLSHDLMMKILESFGARIDRVVINDLHDNTYFARLVVVAPDREFELDARPSDAMAIALRAGAKIFAHSKVLEKSGDDDERPVPANIDPADREKWLEILENMDPEDFGKYKI